MSQNASIPKPETSGSVVSANSVADESGIAMSAGFLETVAFLEKLIAEGAGIYLLTGENGVGKSTALRYVKLNAPENVVAIIHSFRRIDVDNLSDLLGHTLGVKVPQELPPEARALRYFLKLGTIRSKGRRLILMLDDVQELHSSGAELLKALVNMKDENGPLITVVLCGNTALNAFLDKSYRWGIQRLIRENHEMAGFTQVELPMLVESITDSPDKPALPLKSSAFRTLFDLSKGLPSHAFRLISEGTRIAEEHRYPAISSRVLRGAESGTYKTLPNLVTRVTAKAVAAIALLLLVPITLFQQDLQQQRADVPPVSAISSNTEIASTETSRQADESSENAAAENLDVDPGEPAVALVADDISPVLSAQTESQEAASSTQLNTAVAQESSSPVNNAVTFTSFRQLITPSPESSATAQLSSFNQSIPNSQESIQRLLNQYILTIPARPDS